MELSKRLEAIVSFVEKDCKAADVGTDHGYVPIALIKRGIVDSIIAMDVKPGPLKRAQEHVKQMELSEWIDLRLSDGLDRLVPGEADTVMMSGMGGYLIIQLLHRGQQVLKDVKTLILSPQSAAAAVRKYIMKIGFSIVKEVMVEDDEKFYTVIKASRIKDCEIPAGAADDSASNEAESNEAEDELFLQYGKYLLETRDPVTRKYLQKRKDSFILIKEKYLDKSQSLSGQRRLLELKKEIAQIERALEYFQDN